jgi:hypothetical protein
MKRNMKRQFSLPDTQEEIHVEIPLKYDRFFYKNSHSACVV